MIVPNRSDPRRVADLEVEASALLKGGSELQVPVPGSLSAGGADCHIQPWVLLLQLGDGGLVALLGLLGVEQLSEVIEEVELAFEAVSLVGADQRFDYLKPLLPMWRALAGIEGPEPQSNPGVPSASAIGPAVNQGR